MVLIRNAVRPLDRLSLRGARVCSRPAAPPRSIPAETPTSVVTLFGVTPNNNVLSKREKANDAAETNRDADTNQNHTPDHDQPEHIASLRAECDTNSNLTRATRD